MGKILLVFLFLVFLPGCSKAKKSETKTETPGIKIGSTEKFVPEVKESAPIVEPDKGREEVEAAINAAYKRKAVVTEAVKADVKKKTEPISPVNDKNEDIINKNAWGFSIYYPKTGITEYYASNGSLLGNRQK